MGLGRPRCSKTAAAGHCQGAERGQRAWKLWCFPPKWIQQSFLQLARDEEETYISLL